ncbi:hypothetical protein HaLaN_11400 [Haematococcus lacustris]|uniref:Uncharacterized protein n=1 Tax=Haematococcus lacustris TaxID=44745 RepID=A0A699YZQ8_HAELA|nr:hypothetical protein HaLaN_11400 [Haematococcus lacustris]
MATHTTVLQQAAPPGPWVACLVAACSPSQGIPYPWVAQARHPLGMSFHLAQSQDPEPGKNAIPLQSHLPGHWLWVTVTPYTAIPCIPWHLELEATQVGLSAVPTSPPPLDVSHSLHPHGPSAASTPTCTEAETDLVPAEQDGAQVRSPAPPPDASVVMPGAANDVIDTDLTMRPAHDQPAGSHAEPASSSADQSQAAADAETHAANSLAARALLLSEREHFTQLLAQADLRALTAEQTLVHTLQQTQLQLDEVGMESAVLKGLVGTARSVVVGLRQQLSSALESAATQQRIAAETAEKLQQQVQHLQQEARQTACLQQVAAEQAEAARLDGEHAARALQAEVEQQLQTQLKEQADKIVFLEAELNRQQQPQAATAAPDATPTKPPEPPEVAAYQQLTNRCATLQAELHLQTAAAEQLAKHCVALEHQLAEQVAAADSQGQQMGGAHVSSPLQAMRLPGIMGQLASAEQKLAKLQSKYDATKRQLLQLQAAALGGSAVPPGGSEAACSNPGSPLQPSPSVVETSRLRLAALLQLVAATEAKLCNEPKGSKPMCKLWQCRGRVRGGQRRQCAAGGERPAAGPGCADT